MMTEIEIEDLWNRLRRLERIAELENWCLNPNPKCKCIRKHPDFPTFRVPESPR